MDMYAAVRAHEERIAALEEAGPLPPTEMEAKIGGLYFDYAQVLSRLDAIEARLDQILGEIEEDLGEARYEITEAGRAALAEAEEGA